jgi:dynein assembly factor 5, axonemal
MNVLAKSCGLEEGADLFSVELSALIDEMQENYEKWNKHTPERFIFDLLVRRSNTALVERFEDILQIIAANVENPKEYELRMDMLALVEFLLNQDILTETLTFYSEVVLKMILIPATVWKVGSPNVKVRKASVICMMRMVDNKILSKGKLKNNFMEVINVLKGCLDDDWATDIRFTGVVFIRKIIEYLHEELESEDYKEIYPELLKRLDDSQDGIRIATAEAFCIFFKYLPNPWSISLYDYTIKTIFIHLDDQNPEIQRAIRGVLLAAARVQTEKFLEITEEQVGKFQHTSVISGLIEEARKL